MFEMLQAQEGTSDESRSESDSDGCVVAAVRRRSNQVTPCRRGVGNQYAYSENKNNNPNPNANPRVVQLFS